MEKLFLHCDMNNYFASVECIYDKSLKTVPMAVCGDPAIRHGIVLAKNDLAKKYGIMTGESIYSAKQKYPMLKIINANYERYLHYTKLARVLYNEYSDEVVPYGLDEAWIIINTNSYETAENTADEIRQRIKSEFNLSASVGVSYNYIFSKLASDMRKPDKTTVLKKEDLKTKIWNTPAFEMLFVGAATRKKLRSMNILTIGDIACADVDRLRKSLGKPGVNLWQYANGDDSSFNPKVPKDDPFKSFGNTITMPKDLSNRTDILSMLNVLSKTVSARLIKHSKKAKCISIFLKYNDFDIVNRQTTITTPTNNKETIYKTVQMLFEKHYINNKPIRSIGVHVSNLSHSKYCQLSLFE